MPLKFGIPTLDELLEIPATANQGRVGATSLALLGPDGCGKSVLALHLASRYRAQCFAKLQQASKAHDQTLPLIIYVSSDFQYESAETVWNAFGLGQPNQREIPFERMPGKIGRMIAGILSVGLKELVPEGTDDKSEVKFLRKPEKIASPNSIGFLDLARHTAGDDWKFVNSLLVKLEGVPQPRLDDGTQLHHLVIIDSVAGFETFVGKLDAHGLEQTRRARIAQCMRNAAPHSHLVFVVEEPDEGTRLPEEYVTDVVVRLRSRREGGRNLRTVEVEKARARNHAVGEHVFEIRAAKGSSTGRWENADTPISRNAYVHVFHSLSHRNLLVATDPGKGKIERETTVCPFGLRYLDLLLKDGHPIGNAAHRGPQKGLRSGSTNALVGDASTGKSILAEKFIAEGFRDLIRNAIAIYSLSSLSTGKVPPAGERAFTRVLRLLKQSVISEKRSRRTLTDTPEGWTEALKTLFDAARQGDALSQDSLRSLFKELSKNAPEGDAALRREALRAYHPDDIGDKDDTPRSRAHCYVDFEKLQRSAERKRGPRAGLRGEFLVRFFRHPNLRAPGILLTTGDRNASVLAERCLGYLRDEIVRCFQDCNVAENQRVEALRAVKEILEEQLIVRRFDIDSITAPALFDTVQRNVIEAQYLIHGIYFPRVQAQRSKKAERIRLVIDDLRVLSNLCPSVSSDSAFLPFLVFYLEREGVTSLIVHTDGIRPGIRPGEVVSQELQSLLDQVILTWGVPFEGQTRVAISAIPAASKETNGIVREVEGRKIERRDLDSSLRIVIRAEVNDVVITRNFELYADVERDKPRVVPLAVYLYNATPKFRTYMDEEDGLYRELFAAIPASRQGENGRIIWPISATEYLAVRDLTHLPMDVKLDHTVIFQVDSFWSLDAGAGALAPQGDYLTEQVSDHRDGAAHEDPFGLFRGRPKHVDRRLDKAPFLRKDYFQNSEYRSRIVDFTYSRQQMSSMPDRIPFMWDFGFLLVPSGPWDRFGGKEVKFHHPGEASPSWWPKGEREMEVDAVLKGLGPNKADRKAVPWRLFMGACKEVADQTRQETHIAPVPFDFACTSAETLNSLFLEMWFSEITLASVEDPSNSQIPDWGQWLERLSRSVYYPATSSDAGRFSLAKLLGNDIAKQFEDFKERYLGDARRFVQERADASSEPQRAHQTRERLGDAHAVAAWEASLTLEQRRDSFKRLPLGALCLYKTWLLLLDVMDFGVLVDPTGGFEIKQYKEASRSAMAARHFYRTACDQQSRAPREEAGIPDGYYALAMPGWFSVRGDCFLASPRASRSRLLASHAMDLLTSRRANLSRMQMGMGLPVRDLIGKEACEKLRTALRVKTIDADLPSAEEALTEITYGQLCQLGGYHSEELPSLTVDPKWGPRWLFRNAISDYDRVSRPIQKWLTRLFRWTVSYRAGHALGWDGGLKAYDSLSVYRFSTLVEYESFAHFAKLCDFLVAEIEAAQRQNS
jgi:KaiC/GvpD/RAD55 family RecA-like ATPase